MGLLTPGQERFVSALSRETGLNPRVVGAWALAEQSGGAARGYEQRGYNNWLNIANTDSGPAGGAHSGVWSNPTTAARATAEWLRGKGPISKEYGAPAAGIRAILGAHDPMGQIAAIARSGWASSGYNGGADLRSLYGQLAGLKLPPAPAGGSAGMGAGGNVLRAVGGGGAQSEAQTHDLLALLDQLGGQGAPSTSVEGIAVPKPTEAQQSGPRIPQDLAGSEPSVNPADLLGLISKIGEDATPFTSHLVSTPGAGGAGGVPHGGPGHEVNPLQGFTLGRTDMGVDANAKPGTPIRALGNGKVLGISPNWYQGQPYLYYEVLNEHGEPHPTQAFPDAGKVIYTAEQITPHVKPGDMVQAGQTIGTYAPSGTGIEWGIGTHNWQTQAQAEGRTGGPAHENAPAGERARQLLGRLGAR